jgi:hypothetical protein
MPPSRPLDRTHLDPLALEVIDCRDAVLRLLLALNDDRKLMMALHYVTASVLNQIAQSGQTKGGLVLQFGAEVFQAMTEDLMTVDLKTLAKSNLWRPDKVS